MTAAAACRLFPTGSPKSSPNHGWRGRQRLLTVRGGLNHDTGNPSITGWQPYRPKSPFRSVSSCGRSTHRRCPRRCPRCRRPCQRSSKLVGFAVGYLHLRSQGVPVHDVIRMAKSQRRRINLAWSAKRWELEHERLSRAEALDRLAAENATYDVSSLRLYTGPVRRLSHPHKPTARNGRPSSTSLRSELPSPTSGRKLRHRKRLH